MMGGRSSAAATEIMNDNVLYRSLPGLAIPQQVSEPLGGDDYPLKWMTPGRFFATDRGPLPDSAAHLNERFARLEFVDIRVFLALKEPTDQHLSSL
jgi:hypothetical protein